MEPKGVIKPTVGQILSSLSHALDLVEGQPRGHATRTAHIAVRITQALQLDEKLQKEVFYASLIKDSGCSNNSARIQKIFGGDDLLVKGKVKLCDWSNQFESIKFAYTNMAPGGSPVQKLRSMLSALGAPEDLMDDLTRARCTRGAAIARKLGFSKNIADTIQSLDEHWDGRGAPQKLKAYEIPMLSRVINVAQTLEVFMSAFGPQTAWLMIDKRSGKWFQPQIADAAKSFATDATFWAQIKAHLNDPGTILASTVDDAEASSTDIDHVCSAFASIIDAKSTFTGEHSTRVSEYSLLIGRYFNFDPTRMIELERASLLHDVGKLGVSNSILDKPGKLTDEEFEAIKQHPRFTHEILSKIPGFERITEIAGAHHEKLDGRGYWLGLTAEKLDLDMRIVAVADVFDALSAERPYRGAMPLEKVFEILDKEAESGLDPDCVQAMKHMSSEHLRVAA